MQEHILVISTYPPKGTCYGSALSAVSSYTKNTLLSIQKHTKDFRFTILADATKKTSQYQENNITVIRCWKRNSIALYQNLIKEVWKHRDAKKVVFALEWGMFGNKKWLLGLLPLFAFIMRLMGKKIYFVTHGVLLDAGVIASQLGFKKESIKGLVYSFGLKWLYRSLIALSQKMIVFEEALRMQLTPLAKSKNTIATIPHGVDTNLSTMTKREARKKLGIPQNDFVVMVFGFLIWYKGSDWIVGSVAEYLNRKKQSNIKLFMVGGESQVHKNDPVYQQFLRWLNESAKNCKKKITLTGFVKEKDIPAYYAACDIVVFPYRAFLSSSGPLSIAFSYKKPVLLSDKLRGYTKTDDFNNALGKSGLSERLLFFGMDNGNLMRRLENFANNKTLQKKLIQFSQEMRKQRSWDVIGKQYVSLLKNSDE